MLSVEKFCEKISTNISNELKIDEEKTKVINYGIFGIVQMIISIITLIIISLAFGVVVEALIVSVVIAVLRKSSGGVHASSPINCNIIGTAVSLSFGLLAKFSVARLSTLVIIGIMIFIVSYALIFKLAPVDSAAKPIRTEKKRKRLKKSSLIITTVYLFACVVIIGLYIKSRNKLLLVYMLCVYMGLIWQVFSLTKLGCYILKRIDKLLIRL